MASYGRCDTPIPKSDICNRNRSATFVLVSLFLSSYCLSSFPFPFSLFFLAASAALSFVTRPRPSQSRRAPAQVTGPVHRRSSGTFFRVFSFYSHSRRRPGKLCESSRARGMTDPDPLAWAVGRKCAKTPQIGAHLLFGNALEPLWPWP